VPAPAFSATAKKWRSRRFFLCAEKDVPAADDSNRLGEGRLRKVRQKSDEAAGFLQEPQQLQIALKKTGG
jgi:hypothetical protein